MSNTLSEQLAIISLVFYLRVDWDSTLSFLHMFGYGNKFIHMIQVGYANIQSKIKTVLTPLPLWEEFMGVHSQCCYILLGLRYLKFH